MENNKETLASALCKAQSEFLPAAQSGYNPHFKSSFSTMTDLIRATRPALKKYNLSVSQYPWTVDNTLVLKTIVAFGGVDDCLISHTPIVLKDPSNMQEFGKACSYITRYVYKMMLMIEAADEDDDGNASANVAPKEERDWSQAKVQKWHLEELMNLFATSFEDSVGEIKVYCKKYNVVQLGDLKQFQYKEIVEDLKRL